MVLVSNNPYALEPPSVPGTRPRLDTGRLGINPFTNETVPIWVANFVLAEYGTGSGRSTGTNIGPGYTPRAARRILSYEEASGASGTVAATAGLAVVGVASAGPPWTHLGRAAAAHSRRTPGGRMGASGA